MSCVLDRLKNRICGKKITVIGIGISNTPVIRLLVSLGAAVTACDKNENAVSSELKTHFDNLGVKIVLGAGYLDNIDADMVLRTPGLRFDTPQLVQAQKNGAEITSEMELFFEECPCPIFAVTGSDGKTTTTTLICEMLSAQGFTCHKGGNIGRPLLPEIDTIKPADIAIVELSSFQLQDMRRSPDVAVITNLSPNHLDYHKDFEEYVNAKSAIFRYQQPCDRLVYNFDNPSSRDLVKECGSTLVAFSNNPISGDAVFIEDGAIWHRECQNLERILAVSDIRLPGKHNVENYMAAIAAVADYVDNDKIVEVAKNFGGVSHRIEFVRAVDGVDYYNDSIASSPTRAAAGLNSFEDKLVLIAGGYDKNLDYADFGELINERVKKLILVGHTTKKIFDAVTGASNYNRDALDITVCSSFAQAVSTARAVSFPGDTVILSPASASFDMFKNFEVRGDTFKELVNSF